MRGAAAAVAVVVAVAVAAAVAGVAVVEAAAADLAAHRGASAASVKAGSSAKVTARPDHIENHETSWPGSTSSTRPIRVLFVAPPLPVPARSKSF